MSCSPKATHAGRLPGTWAGGLNTVLRYAAATRWQDTFRENRPRPSRLDPYKSYLERRFAEGCTSVTRLHGDPSEAPPRPPTVRQVTGWLTRHPTALTEEVRAGLKDVLARCPELDTAAGHVRDCAEILTDRLGSTLPTWIDARAPSTCRARISPMMTKPTLTEHRSPWVVFTSPADPWLASETAALVQRNGLVLWLDGREMQDAASVFRTFARDLSFLGYFGHNWDALVDYLHDWHGPGHGDQDLAILIEHADDLLKSDFLGLFVSVLAQAAWNSNLRLDADGEPDERRQRTAQHFVFLLDHTAPAAFTEKAARGMDVAVALADGRLLATLTDVDWPGGDPASASWTAGPLSFADNEILSGMTIKAVKLFRDHLGCSIHEALDILQSRSEHLRRKQSDD